MKYPGRKMDLEHKAIERLKMASEMSFISVDMNVLDALDVPWLVRRKGKRNLQT